MIPVGSCTFAVDEIFVIIVKNDDGTEGIAGYAMPEGGIAPFFIETPKKMNSFRGIAQTMAQLRGEATIVRFTGRQEVETFTKKRPEANDNKS